MMSRVSRRRQKIDWITFMIWLALVTIGWLMIYSTGSGSEGENPDMVSGLAGRQLMWIGISLCALLSALLIHFSFWRNTSFIFYFLSLILLVGVLFFGQEVKGAHSWFRLGGFTFQPGELAKMATALAVASYTSSTVFKMKNQKSILTAIALVLLPMILILLQPDAGSALVFLSFFILFYRLGLWQGYFIFFLSTLLIFILAILFGWLFVCNLLIIAGSGLLIFHLKSSSLMHLLLVLATMITVLFIGETYTSNTVATMINGGIFMLLVAWHLFKNHYQIAALVTPLLVAGSLLAFASTYFVDQVLMPHQRDRIHVWLQPEKSDPRGSLYNVIQSKVAISSGGLTGKGFLEGSMTKLNYIPEQSTDFIFCTVGEEQGFIGVLALLALYAVFIFRIILLSESARRPFVRNFGYLFGGMIFFHFFINVGMTMGLVPIIGIPLPFVSYGGSSLIFFSIMVGIFIRLQLDDR